MNVWVMVRTPSFCRGQHSIGLVPCHCQLYARSIEHETCMCLYSVRWCVTCKIYPSGWTNASSITQPHSQPTLCFYTQATQHNMWLVQPAPIETHTYKYSVYRDAQPLQQDNTLDPQHHQVLLPCCSPNGAQPPEAIDDIPLIPEDMPGVLLLPSTHQSDAVVI